jgi:hypothetical protein
VIRLRILPRLVGRSLRLVPWWHLGLGLLAAFALAVSRRNPYPDDLVFGLRVGAVALAASAAFVFDDPAVTLLDGKPVPLSLQRLARLVVALPAVAAAWWLLLSWMEAGVGSGEEQIVAGLPRLALSLEFAALLGCVWAVATLAMRTGRDGAGMVAALSFLILVVVLVLLPERWSLFPSPAVAPTPGEAASERWEMWVDGHRRWAGLAAAAWVATGFGLLGGGARSRLGHHFAGVLRLGRGTS